jgi:hypothetical protein
MANPTDTSPPPPAPLKHEPDVVSIRGVLWSGFGLVVIGVAAAFVIVGVLSWLQDRHAASQAPLPVVMKKRLVLPSGIDKIPGPVLQQKDQTALVELRAKEDRELNRPPHWIDRKKGIVGIPIERAMELVAKDKK